MRLIPIAILTAITLSFCVPASALADAVPEIGASIGTTGYGGYIAVPVTPLVDIRVEGAGASTSGVSVSTDNLQIDGAGSVGNIGVIADLHPFRGYFALEGGLLGQNLRLAGTAQATNGTYVINNTAYSQAGVGTLTGLVKWSNVSPYVGIGGVPANHHGVGIGYDLGAIFQGSPTTTLTASGVLRSDPAFKRDLAAEAAQINGSANLTIYPVIDLSLTYRP